MAVLKKQLLRLSAICTCAIISCSLPAYAEETNNASDAQENGGFMEFNFGLAAYNSRFIDEPHHSGAFAWLRLNLRWEGFFVEDKGDKGLGRPGVGYTFYSHDKWTLDAYISEIHGAVASADEDVSLHPGADGGLTGISPRESDDRLGLRATYSFDDNTALRLFAAPTGFDNRGPYWGAWYGKTWQVQNYNFHAITSAQYHSSNILNYYYGVSGQDVSEKFPAYRAGSGITLSAEVGVTYPLTKDWLIESSLKLNRLPSSISNSPLIDTSIESVVRISLTYVVF
jgi:MipA family protein